MHPISGYQEMLAHLTSSIRFSLRNPRPLCIGRGNTDMAAVRKTAWPEDSSIYRMDCQGRACGHPPSKGDSEGQVISYGKSSCLAHTVRNTQASRNLGCELLACHKLVSMTQTPSQQESFIKTVPPCTFREHCHFENAFTYTIAWDPWDN